MPKSALSKKDANSPKTDRKVTFSKKIRYDEDSDDAPESSSSSASITPIHATAPMILPSPTPPPSTGGAHEEPSKDDEDDEWDAFMTLVRSEYVSVFIF